MKNQKCIRVVQVVSNVIRLNLMKDNIVRFVNKIATNKNLKKRNRYLDTIQFFLRECPMLRTIEEISLSMMIIKFRTIKELINISKN